MAETNAPNYESGPCFECREKDRTIRAQQVLLDSVFRIERSTIARRIADVADSLENLRVSPEVLPMPASVHLYGIVEGLLGHRDTLRSVYVDLAGTNPWEDWEPPHD